MNSHVSNAYCGCRVCGHPLWLICLLLLFYLDVLNSTNIGRENEILVLSLCVYISVNDVLSLTVWTLCGLGD